HGRENSMREDARAPLDVTHTTLSVMGIAVLAAAAFMVLSPFLTSILWAGIISVTAWPLTLRLDAALTGRRSLTVIAITVAILLVIFVPTVLAVGTIVDYAQHRGEQIRLIQSSELPAAPAWLTRLPIVGSRATEQWQAFAALDANQRIDLLTPYVQGTLR